LFAALPAYCLYSAFNAGKRIKPRELTNLTTTDHINTDPSLECTLMTDLGSIHMLVQSETSKMSGDRSSTQCFNSRASAGHDVSIRDIEYITGLFQSARPCVCHLLRAISSIRCRSGQTRAPLSGFDSCLRTAPECRNRRAVTIPFGCGTSSAYA